jgi:hypothetical protein
VVRVRRESDNTEKDFSGSQIESGEMARWVNEQPTLPLDLRELDTNTGERDGALIEAAAAYSLRKLKEDFTGDVVEVRRNVDGETEGFTAAEVTDGTLESFVNASFDDELPLDQATGAAAAYSLRNLSSSYTGNVVEVRRSSDDAVQAFTASEVADGTLEDWVTASSDIVTPTLNNGGFETAGTGGFDYWLESTQGSSTITRDTSEFYSGTASCRFDVDSSASYTSIRTPESGGAFNVGTTLTYFIRAKGTTGSKLLIGNTDSDTRKDTLNLTTEWQEYTGTVNPADTDSTIQIKRKDSANATIWIDEVTLTINGKDGHVRTWYDQSGSDNHAVQTDTAKQPNIVDAGTYLEEVDFDGTQHFETISSGILTNIQDTYSVWLGKRRNNSSGYLAQASSASGGSNRLYLRYGLCTIGAEAAGISIAATNDVNTIVSFTGSGGTYDGFKNGADVNDTETTASTGAGAFTLGASSTGLSPVDGTLKEFIIYDSDQSTKRRAIEENIANHYDISLAAFSRDGTVSTWYDQSETSGVPNANHAVQTDPTKQPKIVDGGSLLKLNGKPSIDFSTVDGYLELSQEVDTSNKPCSIIAATEPTNKALIGQTSNRRLIFNSSDARFGLSVSAITEDYPSVSGGAVFTAIHNGTTTAPNVVIYANGSASTTNDSNQGSPMTAGVIDFIGVNLGSAVTSYFDKKLPEVIIYNTDQTDNRTAIEANIGETYGITDIPAANDTVNGFVQTWYDQSGSGNDAEQSAASSQPKIVGEVTSGQPHAFLGAIDFDGTDDFLSIDFGSTLSQPNSIFMVHTSDTATESSNEFFDTADSAPRTLFDQSGAYYRMLAGINKVTSLTVDANQKTLVGAFYNATSSFLSKNGTASSTFDVGNAPIDDTSNIGYSTPSGNYYDGKMDEFIIYDTDQSSNRPAIEANINNQYDIY